MTKAELIDIVAAETGLTKVDVTKSYEAIFAAIVDALKKEGRFAVSGFGTFDVRERKERDGINPQTKAPIKIKATKSVGFKQSAALKEVIMPSSKKPAAPKAAKAAPAAKAAAPAKKAAAPAKAPAKPAAKAPAKKK